MGSQFSLRQLSGRALLVALCAQALAPAVQAAEPARKPAAAKPARAAAAPPPGEQFVDGIAAVVDKDVITLRELETATAAARRELTAQKIALPPDDVLRKQVLDRLIMQRVQKHEADRMGIRVQDAQIDKAIQSIAERNKVSVKTMQVEVEKSGLNWSDYRQSLADQIRLDQMRQRAVDSTIVISDAEVDAYLKEQARRGGNIGMLAQPGAGAPAGAPAAQPAGPAVTTLAQILVRVPEGSSSEEVARLRRKADDLLAQARSGGDFAALAAAGSDGPEALQGGVMGTRPEDGWPTLFVDATANLPAGQVSDVVRSGNGFHILKVVARQRQGSPAAAPASQPARGPAPDSQTRQGAAQGPMHVTQTRARHILIKTSTVMSDEQARQRLEQIRQRIVSGGESMADLARQNSQDATAPQGGDLGWVNPGETVPPFEQAMNALEPGQVSQPVQSPFGWHLIQVEERREQDVADDYQRMQARQALFERRAEPAMEDWLSQLRDQAFVDNRIEKQERVQSTNQ